MSLQKALIEQLKRHFIDNGPAGKHKSKGRKHYVCNYRKTRFVGSATNLRDHFLKGKCGLDHMTRQLDEEERVRRMEGIRMGTMQAESLVGGRGSAGAGPSSAPSRSSLVAPSLTASRPPIPAIGETTTPATSGNAAPSLGRPTRQTLIEEANSIITRNEQTRRHLDRFVICTNQPFNLIENHYFLQLIDAVKKSHPSWWPCKRDEMRTKRLDGQHKIVGDEMKSLVRRCMLQMDGWSDRRNKPHLNVMVSSPIGTVFWKSVCMEGKDKDSAAYFKLLEGVIEEVGPRSVVGVMMDNARVCAKAGKMVEAKYPGIFSVGCTTHALDLALEDMYTRLDWMKEVVDKGNQVGKFVTNIDKVCAMFNRIANAQPVSRSRVPATDIVGHGDPRGVQHLTLFVGANEVAEGNQQWVCGAGTLGTLNAKEQAKVQTPALWWEAFGGSLDLLQPQAIKLLGEVSSSATCEHNWSLHQLIYGQRRTKLLPESLAKLVYSNWNIQLTTRRERGETEDNHIPWKDNELAKTEVDEWYEDWTTHVIEGRAADAAAAEVADDDDEDGPLVRTWQKNDEEDDLADEEDDVALLGSVERTWHANMKPGKHRGRDRAMSARQAGDWVHGREEASGRRQRKRKAATPEPDEERPTRKGKSKEGGDGVAPPKRKRGRPPLSPANKAAKAATEAAKKAAEDEAVAAKAAKASSVAEARPKRKREARVMEDDDDNLRAQAAVQSSGSASSSSDESGKSSLSASSSEEDPKDEQSLEESGGEHESGEEAE
ncbi:hypothetical protein CBR_g38619 [Chara braunii]|uniref:Uncharacterized protein n=1 Tax=Chara braunii TaxID=69332 RepID=A0A388K0I6_CHABU|nr:hypothetical protein CBR_g38619 [Chara braunii]|eukprot:GBG63552.1 hypothetical protein CBR_g38619 [Chara braunii]